MNEEEFLKELRNKLKEQGKTLQVIWGDEYGGAQSVILSDWDQIKIVPSRSISRSALSEGEGSRCKS